MPTKSIHLVKIGPGYSEIFGVICRCLPYRCKSIISNIVISGVTGLNLTKFIHNAETFMPFNLLKSDLRYCNPFRNASTTNEGMSPISPILRQKLVAMATSLERSQDDQVINPFHTPTNPENSSEIRGKN